MSSFSPVSPDVVDEAVDFCRGAGALLREAYQSHAPLGLQHKGPIDLVTEADRQSEDYLLKRIHKSFPGHAIWAEESGRERGEGPYRWVIDPLDGTVNFAHRIPHFAVLVALQEQVAGAYHTVLGITLDPMRQELFVAVRGGGARCNDVPIHTSACTRLIDATFATGFAYDRLFRPDDNHREYCRLNLVSQGVRRFGSAGLDLAWVACGRMDGFWESGLKPWDMAAGVLMVHEAGGEVTGMRGESFVLEDGHVCAAGPGIHRDLLAALASAANHPPNSREGLSDLLPDELARQLRE